MTTNQLCKRCSGPITFRQLPGGKWLPVELNGAEHWDNCKRRQRIASGLLNSDGTVNRTSLEQAKPIRKTVTNATHLYTGELPPWDDSLGEFRDFTETEKQAGEICEAV